MARVVSGVKPTGLMTLGNYLGALKRFPGFMQDYEVFIFIADLHALTLPIEPQVLQDFTRQITAFYLASGLNPDKATIFLQSMVSEHAELNTILQNYTYLGELYRMTQFKEKSLNQDNNGIGIGLLTYPVLMAGDILLYDADFVPVGDDQKQHIELTRDLVNRLNNRYGKILTMPKPLIGQDGSRIMSLTNPTKKMSKSEPAGAVFLTDTPEDISKKFKRAVTDSENIIKYDVENKPGISNLLAIYAVIKNISIKEAEAYFKDFQYGQFKVAVGQTVIDELAPFQARYQKIIQSDLIDQVLKDGAEKAREIARVTLNRVKKAIGLYDPQ